MPPRKPATPNTRRPRQDGVDDAPKPRPRRQPKNAPGRVLVTGAGGLVGRALVSRLRESGWRLITLSHRPPTTPAKPGEIHVTADVCGRHWQQWCEDCVAAIHVVGAPRPVPSNFDLERAHVLSTERLIQACHELGVRRLITVSAAAPTAGGGTPFLQTKFAAEQLVERSGLDWSQVRPTVVFGPGDRFSTGLAGLARRLPVIPVPGDGHAMFQPVAADDLASLLAALLESRDAVGRTVEVGGPERLSLNQMLQRVVEACGQRRTLLHLPPRLGIVVLRTLRHRNGPWLTDDAIDLLLSGSVAAPLPPELALPQPARRFSHLGWLDPRSDAGF